MKYQLGILGLGSRSTLYYLNSLNQYYNELNGGYSTCPFLLLNADFNTINPFLPNQFQEIIPPLTKHIEQLLNLGAQKILIPNITLHEALDKIDKFDKNIFIHPLHLLKNEIRLKNKRPTVILGTRHSMNNPYFNSFIENEGIQVYRPVKATCLSPSIYQIFPIQVHAQEDEDWQFKPGSIVVTTTTTTSDQIIEVATAYAPPHTRPQDCLELIKGLEHQLVLHINQKGDSGNPELITTHGLYTFETQEDEQQLSVTIQRGRQHIKESKHCDFLNHSTQNKHLNFIGKLLRRPTLLYNEHGSLIGLKLSVSDKDSLWLAIHHKKNTIYKEKPYHVCEQLY